MSVITIGGGPRPQSVRVVPDGSKFKIVDAEDASSVFASGFDDEEGCHRYLKAIAADDPSPSEA